MSGNRVNQDLRFARVFICGYSKKKSNKRAVAKRGPG